MPGDTNPRKLAKEDCGSDVAQARSVASRIADGVKRTLDLGPQIADTDCRFKLQARTAASTGKTPVPPYAVMSADEWKTSLGNVNRDGRGADEEPRDASGIVFSQPLGRLPPRHSAVGF
jgi:hypothetical protein